MKNIEVATILLICAAFLGCESSTTNQRVEFVDRNAGFSQHISPPPLMLLLEIDAAGRLRLNNIDTGTTRDTSLLAEKLEAIFADRERSGIDKREVLIDPKIDPKTEGFKELLATLADVKAAPIRVIKNDR